jgi:quercetin dioxygenase-like cupin family protein
VKDISGQDYWLLGSLATVHVAGRRTEDPCCVVEFLNPPDDMLPLHVHRSDQTTYLLEGEIIVYLPGESHVLGPGQCIYHPAGVRKTERVTSSAPARALDINAPAGFDRFIAAAGEKASSHSLPPLSDEPPDFERITALAAEHGIDILGPPGTMP